MAGFKTFLKSGHAPTLFAAFLYFDFCFAVWVLNGAMAPFISETFNLTAAQKGFMISVPILAGAFMRFPLGILAQYVGRKNAAVVEMGMVMGALAFGFFFIRSYNDVIAMGVLLGIASASFGVALSLGSGSSPPSTKAWPWALPVREIPALCWPYSSRHHWPWPTAGKPCMVWLVCACCCLLR